MQNPAPRLTSRKGIVEFLRERGYHTEFTPWPTNELPRRVRELIGSMHLLSHYEDGLFPFQAFLIELDVPAKVRRIRRTDIRIILKPFYLRWPQGEYLFIFALPNYSNVALVSPKRIQLKPSPMATPTRGAKFKLQLLYFIQRKGWLGDNPRFIKKFWEAYRDSGNTADTFFKDWLSVLFFEAFNNCYQNRAEYIQRLFAFKENNPEYAKILYK